MANTKEFKLILIFHCDDEFIDSKEHQSFKQSIENRSLIDELISDENQNESIPGNKELVDVAYFEKDLVQ